MIDGVEIADCCLAFPVLSKPEYDALKDDISANGLLETIKRHDGKVIDGRTRLTICSELGIDPRFEDIDCDNPWRYAWSMNGVRRHCPETVKVASYVKCEQGAEAWDVARGQVAESANEKRSEATSQQPRTEDGRRLSGLAINGGETRRDYGAEQVRKASTLLAALIGVGRAAVEKILTIAAHAPELLDKIITGEIKTSEAQRQVRRAATQERVSALPDDIYRIIYADPPWKYGDERNTGDGRESTSATYHYATMARSELEALEIKKIAADDCVLLCWATFPLLPDALTVVKAWGFTYKTAFVWDKTRGAFGHYHTAEAELLLVATRGDGVPEVDKRVPQIHRLARGEHSAKPDYWRALIDQLWPSGQRIILFHRGGEVPGWDTWGAEALIRGEVASVRKFSGTYVTNMVDST